MPYRHLDNLSISDVAFAAWGKSREDMFLASAEATLSLMVENLKDVKTTQSIDIFLKDESLELLLFAYLQELIFYKDAKRLFLRSDKPAIKKEKNIFLLKCKFKGEKIDQRRHRLSSDIKAVTFYSFRVEKKNNNWYATVALDV